MSNPIVTVLCFAALCCQLEGKPGWAGPILFIALALAIWNNLEWAKVLKAAAMLLKATRK